MSSSPTNSSKKRNNVLSPVPEYRELEDEDDDDDNEEYEEHEYHDKRRRPTTPPFAAMLRDMWTAVTVVAPREAMKKQADYVSTMHFMDMLEKDPFHAQWETAYAIRVRPLLKFAADIIRARPSGFRDLSERCQALFHAMDHTLNDTKRGAVEKYNQTLHRYPFYCVLNNLQDICMQLAPEQTQLWQPKYLTAVSLLKDRAREHTLCLVNAKFNDEAQNNHEKAVFWLDFEVTHFRPLVQEYMQIVRDHARDYQMRLSSRARQLFVAFKVVMACSGSGSGPGGSSGAGGKDHDKLLKDVSPSVPVALAPPEKEEKKKADGDSDGDGGDDR